MPNWINPQRVGALFAAGFAVVVTAHVVTAAFAPSCASQPRSSWLSSYEIGLRLQQRGYEMVRLRMGDDRCVDIVARDKKGQFVDLLVNPFNAEIVRVGGK